MATDGLFAVRNSFFLGAYQTAINEAADLETLGPAEQIDRDVYVYRSYIALGSHEVLTELVWLCFMSQPGYALPAAQSILGAA